MESCEAVALEFGRDKTTIYNVMRRFEPTNEVAEAYLKAQALRLAVRVVREANPEQAIDILSRKNMGVIAPKAEEGAGGGGFFLSVQADSCGAVKIGVATQAPMFQQEGQTEDADREAGGRLLEESTVIDAEPESVYKPRPKQGHIQTTLSDRHKATIEAAQARVKKAQRRARRLKKHTAALESLEESV